MISVNGKKMGLSLAILGFEEGLEGRGHIYRRWMGLVLYNFR